MWLIQRALQALYGGGEDTRFNQNLYSFALINIVLGLFDTAFTF